MLKWMRLLVHITLKRGVRKMKPLLFIARNAPQDSLFEILENRYEAEIIRFDLAWELFLRKAGRNKAGQLDLPPGNPRTQWFSLHLWVRQTLGGLTDALVQKQRPVIGIIRSCSPAALEYVIRMMSIYFGGVGVLDAAENAEDPVLEEVERFLQGETVDRIQERWIAPVVNVTDAGTPLLERTSKTKGGGAFTWLTGVLGSDRLFSQVYRLAPHASGNRLHHHSDVDEMYVVLEGTGILRTNHGNASLKPGDIVVKPAGSGLATQFIAGDNGMTILDIESWNGPDQTDVVGYLDHREVFLRGRGLNHVVPLDSCLPGDDMMAHYNDAYVREKSGQMRFGEEA